MPAEVDRDAVDELLRIARSAQGAYWEAVRALEKELGTDYPMVKDGLHRFDMEEVTVEELLDKEEEKQPHADLDRQTPAELISALNWAITSEQAVTWRTHNAALIKRWKAIRDDLTQQADE